MKVGIFGGEYVHKHFPENFTPSWVQILSKKYDVTAFGSVDIDLISLHEIFLSNQKKFDKVIFVIPKNKLANATTHKNVYNIIQPLYTSTSITNELLNEHIEKFLNFGLNELVTKKLLENRSDVIIINSRGFGVLGLDQVKRQEEIIWNLKEKNSKLEDVRQCGLSAENNQALANLIEQWFNDSTIKLTIDNFSKNISSADQYFITQEEKHKRRKQFKDFEKISPTFCHYPFKEIAIKEFRGTELLAFWPCCMMGNDAGPNKPMDMLDIKNPSQYTPQEMFDHPRMQTLRSNKLMGVKDKACLTCWDQESRGIESFRSSSREHSDIEGKTDLYVIDVTASNLCNLRCRMCTPSASNLLMQDYKYFEENKLLDRVDTALDGRFYHSIPYKATDTIQWQWLMENTKKIHILKASGGEPFYDGKIIRLLEKYVETDSAKHTTLSFHTNATQFNDSIIEILKNFKLNEHTFSVDGFEKVYEYIRYPATFEELTSSIDNYITKLKNVNQLQFNCVVSSLNILNLDRYINWINNFKMKSFINLSEMYPPGRGTSIRHLPTHILEESKRRLLNTENKRDRSIKNMIVLIDNAIRLSKENKNLMLEEITLFDESRNQSYEDFLDPLLVDWLKT